LAQREVEQTTKKGLLRGAEKVKLAREVRKKKRQTEIKGKALILGGREKKNKSIGKKVEKGNMEKFEARRWILCQKKKSQSKLGGFDKKNTGGLKKYISTSKKGEKGLQDIWGKEKGRALPKTRDPVWGCVGTEDKQA